MSLANERHIHKLATASSPAPLFAASFQSPTALHLVSAFAPCGSLWDRVCEMLPSPGLDTGRMDEDELTWWARQMVSAISWIHGVGYAHRDVKPHNFLLLPDARLWLTDFGSAAPLANGSVPRRHCMLPAGTPDYVAPEVLRMAEDAMIEAAQTDQDDSFADRTIRQMDIDQPGYGPDIDWWSLGATLYELSVGRSPFFAPSIGGTYDRIMRCDMRMPDTLSPQLKSLLSGLLSPREVRLGRKDAGQIRKHSFFREVDWTKQGTPPPGIVSQSIDLNTLAESFDNGCFNDQDDGDDMNDITFEHYFDNTTVGFTTTLSTSVSMAASAARPAPPVTWGRWVGWSWDPPCDFFGAEPPVQMSPNMSTHALPALRQLSAPPLLTPMRVTSKSVSPQTVPRTAPRSMPRTRPVSERQAFNELIKCVQASARKKLASVIKMPGSAASTASSIASAMPVWRKEQPPTPTPMSRDVTVTSLASRAQSINEAFPPTGSATASGGSGSSATNSAAYRQPPPRPLSRTSMHSRDDLPSRPLSRTSTRSDIHSAGGGASSSATYPSSGPARPRSRQSSAWSSKDETFLARLVAVDQNAIENNRERAVSSASGSGSGTSRSASISTASASASDSHGGSSGSYAAAAAAAAPPTPAPVTAPRFMPPPSPPPSFSPPPHHGYASTPAPAQARGGRIAPRITYARAKKDCDVGAMAAWHESLVDGYSVLERRLADMTARLAAQSL